MNNEPIGPANDWRIEFSGDSWTTHIYRPRPLSIAMYAVAIILLGALILCDPIRRPARIVFVTMGAQSWSSAPTQEQIYHPDISR